MVLTGIRGLLVPVVILPIHKYKTTIPDQLAQEMASTRPCYQQQVLIPASKFNSSKRAVFTSNACSSPNVLANRVPLSRDASWPLIICGSTKQSSNSFPSNDDSSRFDSNSRNFCIIEGPEIVPDSVQMQLQEIEDNIRSRRNTIFLLMEELRRLRVQRHIRNVMAIEENNDEDADEMPHMPSSLPFFNHMTPKTLKQLYLTSFSLISAIITFGGLLAPSLELKVGLGGTSYADFIHSMHLPLLLSQVDPIVASFSGGAVGVISALMVLEVSNVVQQEKNRCKYCRGTGYLACALCSASGVEPNSAVSVHHHPLQLPVPPRCPTCLGTGKVMCPTCLCTGMAMASEHDRRMDPFD